ncbi:MAG: hypothetical protein AAFU85_27180 [Planctomycetota bacterium]
MPETVRLKAGESTTVAGKTVKLLKCGTNQTGTHGPRVQTATLIIDDAPEASKSE